MSTPLDRLREITARNVANGGAVYEVSTPRARVEREILAAFDNDYEPDAREVAEALVDADVVAGDYEGCSSELELAFTEYERIAEEVLR